jgi:hypothetical protein
MKRLFAVAVSVGFASTLTRMAWITNGTWPSCDEWPQMAVLLSALIATIGSWEGYFAAIDNRPLEGMLRFTIDIALVFIYMILLISSVHTYLLLPILVLIFALYIMWDSLTILEHPDYYYYDDANAIPQNCVVFTTYRRGILSSRRVGSVRRGHIITALWAAYFFGLLAISHFVIFGSVYVICVMTWIGLIVYRLNKATPYDANGEERKKSGRTVLWIFILVIALLGARLGLALYLKV